MGNQTGPDRACGRPEPIYIRASPPAHHGVPGGPQWVVAGRHGAEPASTQGVMPLKEEACSPLEPAGAR